MDNLSAKAAGWRSGMGNALATLNGRMLALFRLTIGSMSSETNALVPTLIATPASMSVRQFGIISACPGWMCATGSLSAFTKFQVGLGRCMALASGIVDNEKSA